MRKIILPCLAISIILISCSTSKKTTNSSSNNNEQGSATTTKSTENALSYATAVVINETNEGAGVKAEYEWIK